MVDQKSESNVPQVRTRRGEITIIHDAKGAEAQSKDVPNTTERIAEEVSVDQEPLKAREVSKQRVQRLFSSQAMPN